MDDNLVTGVADSQPAVQCGAPPLVLGGDPGIGSAVSSTVAVPHSSEGAGEEELPIAPKPATMPSVAADIQTGGAAEPEFEEAQDFSKEPLEARLSNAKDLNRRCSAYAELQASMETSNSEAFALFSKHLDVCIGETLPKGQDAALSALAVYLEHSPELEASQVQPLVRKLIEHKAIDKPKMQLLVPPVVVLVTEICEGPVVLKEILECLSALESAKKKTQGFFKKQVAFIIKLFYHLLADFGPQRISPIPDYVSVVLKYITDSDRGIREACYSVLVELTLWQKDISAIIKTMEDPQKKELAKRVADVKEEDQSRGVAKRRYRHEKACDPSTGSTSKDVTEVVQPIDEFTLVEAVDAVKKLPKGWCINKVFSMEKWKEKQQHLQIFANAVDVTRLVPNDFYASLVPALQRLLKAETNIPVFGEVVKCMGLMAKGLRKEFERPARQILPTALTRINDKSVWKPNQPSFMIERVEQLLWSVPFEVLVEETRVYVSSKSQFVKKEAMALLIRSLDLPAVQQSCGEVAQKFFAPLVAMALPNIDDADNLVRQEAAKFLATLATKNNSSPELAPLLDKVPPHRRNFFEEEWKRQAKELGLTISLPSASSNEDVDSVSQNATQARPSLRQPSPLRSARGGGEAENRPASPTPASRAERALAGSPSKGNKTPRLRGSANATTPRLQIPSSSQELPARSRGADVSTDEVASAAPQSTKQGQATKSQVEDMAKQIEMLQAEVQALRDREVASTPRAAPAPTTAPTTARTTTRTAPLRAASSERLAPQGRTRALTPQRFQQPQRAQSAGRQHEERAAAWEPVPERRLSNLSAGCASPLPAKRAAARSVGTTAPPGATRAQSTEARMRRNTSSEILPARRDSHGSEAGLAFKLELPRVPKATRQMKERNQYWGPEQIPAEFLTNLKDCLKPCVDERCLKNMFSDKMEEQLLALQVWKRQVSSDFQSVLEVLDIMLKWLTWVLFNTNTQIWKSVIDVLSVTLSSLAAAEQQITDREAQILVPNIVERSGHNNLAIRDGMISILRQSLQVYPRVRILPMLLQGIASKNKRSATCAMRAIGDALDRQVAMQLAKAQKDMSVVLRMLDDKDAELRKGAVHVVASLSHLIEAEVFARICKSLSKDTVGVVRAAAARLPQDGQAPAGAMGQEVSSLEISQLSTGAAEGPRLRPATPPRRTGAESIGRERPSSNSAIGVSPSTRQLRSRMESPQRETGAIRAPEFAQGQEVEKRRLSLNLRTPKQTTSSTDMDTPKEPTPSPSPAAPSQQSPSPSSIKATKANDSQVSYKDLVRQLETCDDDTFKEICGTIVRSLVKGEAFDAAAMLAQVILVSLQTNFVSGASAVRCEQTGEVMQHFCARKEWREVADDIVLRVLRELLQKLNNNGGWKSSMRDGTELLKKLNLACVMLLTTIHRRAAYSHLLELGLTESDPLIRKLVAKCLRKVNNNLCRSKDPEREAKESLEVIHGFAQRARPALSAGGEKAASDLQPVLDGVREVVDAVCRACPEAATQWTLRALASSLHADEVELLKEQHNLDEGDNAEACRCLLIRALGLEGIVGVSAKVVEKENVPVATPRDKGSDQANLTENRQAVRS